MVLGFATADDTKEDEIVDAIENGRIVRVKESYAREEGLMILKRALSDEDKAKQNSGGKFGGGRKREDEYARRVYGDDLRKPLRWLQNKVVADLVPNFQWVISQARRVKNVSRKQVADAIGEPESSVKMIENGVLPKDDFVLVNKIQTYFGINLRKDKADYSGSALRTAISSKPQDKPAVESQKFQENSQKPGSVENSADDFTLF